MDTLKGVDTLRFGITYEIVPLSVTCTKDRPRFAYLAPTYAQGKTIALDYIQHYSRPSPGVTSMRENADQFMALPISDAAKQAIVYGNAKTLFV